jgi:transaldolase
MLNDNQMAIEKLAEGIRRFASDQIKLENFVRERILAHR